MFIERVNAIDKIGCNHSTNQLGALMNKFFITLSLFFVAINASAQSYITVGYGSGSTSHDELVSFSGTNSRNLLPDDVDDVWSVALGMRKLSLGIEIGYSQFSANSSESLFIEGPGQNNNFQQTTDTWEAELQAKQFFVKPIRFYDVSDDLRIKTGLGVTYTKYVITGNSHREIENLLGHEVFTPISGVINPQERTADEFGVIGSLGFDYVIWKSLSVGFETNISYDDISTTINYLGTVGFRF